MGESNRIQSAEWTGMETGYVPARTREDAARVLVEGIGIFVGLSVLLRLPDLVAGTVPTDPVRYLEHPFRAYYLFSLDLFALASLLSVVPHSEERSRVRGLVMGSILFLLVYRTYDAVVVTMLHRSPIFYADASHLVGAVYLLVNASLPMTDVATGIAAVGLFGGLMWALPPLLRRLHRALATPGGRRGVLVANAIVWPLVIFAAMADHRGTYLRRATYQSVCLSTTECLVRNVNASWTLRHEVTERAQGTSDSTYVGYQSLARFDHEWG